jgi:CRP-like cAMP-binding protein
VRSPNTDGIQKGADNRVERKPFEAVVDGVRIFEDRLIKLNIAPDVARQLVNRHTNFHYSKGDIIFLPGAPADMLYCVRKGLVGLYAATEDSNRVLVKIAGPGDLLSNIDFLSEKEHSNQIWEAQARCLCQIALISRDHFAHTLQTVNREVLLHLFEQINAEWSMQMNRWVRFLGLDYRQRLELVFSELSKRFGVTEARGILLVPEFSHSDFAEMIGSSRPMASRLVAELIHEGLLLQQGRHYIVQLNSSAA